MNTISISQGSVNTILPQVLRRMCLLHLMNLSITSYLKPTHIIGKILLTYRCMPSQEANHETKSTKREKRVVFTKQWSIEHPPGPSSRGTLSNERIFRPTRFTSSPLRDDTMPSGGQCPHFKSITAVWCQPRDFLQNTWNVRSRRPRWSDPTTNRTEEPVQMYGRNYRIRQATAFTESRYDLGRHDIRSIQRIWCYSPSPNYRTRTCQIQKKGNDSEITGFSGFEEGATMMEEYEHLRIAMIEPDKELPTPGYGVFKLRGMMGWIKALPVLKQTKEEEIKYTGNGLESSRIQSTNYTSVVHILANMVISCFGGCP